MKELRPAIIRMHQRGIPKREISRLLDIPLTTVFKDIKRYEETGTNEDRPRRGRKRTSRTPANRRRARGMINRNPTIKRNSTRKRAKKQGISKVVFVMVSIKKFKMTCKHKILQVFPLF